ncbi:hypothetical protein GTY73_02545 [Streptomyces sp. SID8354]|nr:hypothetical protein [Streptomyces sp. SID8354]
MTVRTGRRRRPGSPAAAGVFAIGMAGTTLPTPRYALYRHQLGFSELMVTVGFATYALGVIAVLFGFFLIAYLGISLPVVGVGALTMTLGLRNAGLAFAGCVVAVAVAVGGYVLRRPLSAAPP